MVRRELGTWSLMLMCRLLVECYDDRAMENDTVRVTGPA
jgi:hypothetical protein